MILLKYGVLLLALLLLLPLGISLAGCRLETAGTDWRTADRSSAGLLAPAAGHPAAAVRIFAARTVRWRGIFAVHCWIVVKPEGAAEYTRYDYTAWGEPIRVNGFVPDGRWFGRVPDVVFAADGPAAADLIPRIEAAVAAYALSKQGDYRAWPGPNSNTFVAAVLGAIPESDVALPPTAIGKDYPYDGRWLRPTPSRTGLAFTLGGYGGLTVGWVEGLEVNILGLVVGVDWRRPALKLPGVGRIGIPAPTTWSGPAAPPQAAVAGTR
jgi:hypothetical protein